MKHRIYDRSRKETPITEFSLIDTTGGITLVTVDPSGMVQNYIATIKPSGELLLHASISKEFELKLDEVGHIIVRREL